MNESDFALVRAMRDHHLLTKVNPALLNISEETGAVICSDCHQRQDINKHLEDISFASMGRYPLLHTFQLNGIAFRLVPSKVVEKFREDNMLIVEIADAISLGKIKNHFLILGHYPCGIAAKFNLSLYDCVELMCCGRNRIMNQFRQLNASCLLQVDYTGFNEQLGKRTYHLSTSSWPTFRSDFARYDHTSAPIWLPDSCSESRFVSNTSITA